MKKKKKQPSGDRRKLSNPRSCSSSWVNWSTNTGISRKPRHPRVKGEPVEYLHLLLVKYFLCANLAYGLLEGFLSFNKAEQPGEMFFFHDRLEKLRKINHPSFSKETYIDNVRFNTCPTKLISKELIFDATINISKRNNREFLSHESETEFCENL